jgi:hypothetical protein
VTTAISRHIATEAEHGRRSLLWHLCAVRGCLRFVERSGEPCWWCAVKMVRFSAAWRNKNARP